MSTCPQQPESSELFTVLIEQYVHWRRGERHLVEEYLSTRPALQKDPERLLDLIYQEVVLREERGEKPRLADYEKRFPSLASMLRDQFLIHRLWIP